MSFRSSFRVIVRFSLSHFLKASNVQIQLREKDSSMFPDIHTAQEMKFSIKDFFSKLRIWSHLLKKSLMENFIFCAVSSLELTKVFQ